MSRRRRFTVGRAFALLILGIGIGLALFVVKGKTPQVVREEVDKFLDAHIAAPHSVADVTIGLDTGVTLSGLRVLYPDGSPALTVEQVVLTIDQGRVLRGELVIRQVDFYGMMLRLRRDPDGDGTPSLPGIFRPAAQPGASLEAPGEMPLLQVHPGDNGSWVEIVDSPLLVPGTPVRLRCLRADAQADGPIYHASGSFSAEHVERLDVDLLLDPGAGTLQVQAKADHLTWQRGDEALLAADLRKGFPPVELGGQARAEARALVDIRAFKLLSIEGHAELSHLNGVFGNVYTGQPVGLPFGVRDGQGTLTFANGRLSVKDLGAVFVSPAGTHGRLSASVDLAFDRVGTHLDLMIHGEGIEGSTEDLRHLLPPDVVETIVEQFLPGGTFDFDVTVSQRPAHEEKVVANLTISNGKLDYAGNLDELTGRRFGFRYPLERCHGSFRIETHVPTARGLAETIQVKDLRAFNPISRPKPGGPRDVAVVVNGRVLIYDLPDRANREDIDISIDVTDLPIDAKLATAFASTPEGSPYEDFDLTGWAPQVNIRVQRDGFLDAKPRATYDILLDHCTISYRDFPLRIQDVQGRIFSQEQRPHEGRPASRLLQFDHFRGRAAEGGTFEANGWVRQYDDDTEEMDLSISAERVRVGADLERALLQSAAAGTGVVDIWRSLRPTGFVGADVTLQSPGRARIEIKLDELTFAGYQDIDCPLSGLEGRVYYDNGTITLENVSGRIFDQATFHVGGAFREGGGFELRGEVDQLVLRHAVQRILNAVAPAASRAIGNLRLDADSAFDVILTASRVDADAPVEFACTLDDLDVRSRLFGFDLSVRGGPIVLGLDALRARDIWLRAGDGQVHLIDSCLPHDAHAQRWAVLDAWNLEPAGHISPTLGEGLRQVLGENIRANLTGFRVEYYPRERNVTLSGAVDLRRYELRAEELGALEPTGQIGLSPLTLRLPVREGDPIRYFGVIDANHLNLNLPINAKDLSGQVRVAEGTIGPDFTLTGSISGGRATVFDRVLEDMSLNLTYNPRYLGLGNVDGRFYGGAFKGDVEIHLGRPGAFQVRVRAEGVQLGEMLKEDLPRSEPMSGSMAFALDVESPSGEPRHMRGEVQVRVENGQLFRVPGLRRILSVLSRVTPIKDKRFERAEADLKIRGEEIEVEKFSFSTDLNDVRGSGTASIYGDLDLVVKPQVTRAIDLPRLLNIPVLSSILNLWHATVYEIRLEGTIDSPALRLRALPFLGKPRPRATQTPHAGRAERMRPRILP